MTAEAALISLLHACAAAALLLSVGRLIYLFAVPYAEPAEATVRRGPGSRTRLLQVVLVAAVLGGLLLYGGFAVLLNEAIPKIVRFVAYAAIFLVAGIVYTLISGAVTAQNQMADDHEIKVGRGHASRGRLWRSNTFEIALLFGFGAGVLLICGPGLPDLRDISEMPTEALKDRVMLLHFVALWTFLAGGVTTFFYVLRRNDDGIPTIIGTLVAFVVIGSVSRWAYGHAAPTLKSFDRGMPEADALAEGLAQAETMALIGLTLVFLLAAAPMVDLVRQAVAPRLKAHFARLLGLVAAFAAFVVAFAWLSPALPAAFPAYLIAATLGIAAGTGIPLLVSRAGPHQVVVIGGLMVLALLALLFASNFHVATALLAASAVLGAGTLPRAPQAAEPAWAEVF